MPVLILTVMKTISHRLAPCHDQISLFNTKKYCKLMLHETIYLYPRGGRGGEPRVLRQHLLGEVNQQHPVWVDLLNLTILEIYSPN